MFTDTNAVISLLTENQNEEVIEKIQYYINNDTAFISETVLMEILSWSELSEDEAIILKRKVLSIFKVKKHNRSISLITAKIRRLNKKIKLPDAIIAATAIYYNMPLLTNDTSDFKNISELQIIYV